MARNLPQTKSTRHAELAASIIREKTKSIGEVEDEEEEEERVDECEEVSRNGCDEIKSIKSADPAKNAKANVLAFATKNVYSANECADILERLRHLLSNKAILATQLAIISSLFDGGRVKKTSWGNYRVEMLVERIPFLIDLENIELVYTTLSAREVAAVCFRVGLALPGNQQEKKKPMEFTVDGFFEKLRRLAAGIEEDYNNVPGRAGMRRADSTLSSSAKIDINKAFKKIDKDGSGTLCKPEMFHLFHDLGMQVDDETLDAVFTFFDPNNSGSINVGEFAYAFYNRRKFTKAYEGSEAALSTKEAQEHFAKMDKCGDGFLQEDEFGEFLLSMEMDLDEQEKSSLFQQIDKTGRGSINYLEFTQYLRRTKEEEARLSGKRIGI